MILNAENSLDARLSDYQPLFRPEPGPGRTLDGRCVGAAGGDMINLRGSFSATVMIAEALGCLEADQSIVLVRDLGRIARRG